LVKKINLLKKPLVAVQKLAHVALDKDAEFEADRMGLILAARAGYDAYGLARSITNHWP
jgi:beta-barrel assembly-enhancing protease